MQTLVPLLCRLAERPEESVHESVAAALTCICPALGHFANDGELKLLLHAYQINLGHESSAVRRAAAQALLGFCKNARKPTLFLGCLVALLIKAMVPPTAALPRTQVTKLYPIWSLAGQILSINNLQNLYADISFYNYMLSYTRGKTHRCAIILKSMVSLIELYPRLIFYFVCSRNSKGHL